MIGIGFSPWNVALASGPSGPSLGPELVSNGDMSAEPTMNGNGTGNFRSADSVSGGVLRINATEVGNGANVRIQHDDAALVGETLRVSFRIRLFITFPSVTVQRQQNGSTSSVQVITGTDWNDVEYDTDCLLSTDRPWQLSFTNNTNTTDVIEVDDLSIRTML